jgi:hypothetical protein
MPSTTDASLNRRGRRLAGLFKLAVIASVVGGIYTTRYTGVMLGAATNFTQLSDIAMMVSVTEPSMKWDGVAASFSVLLGTPPANGKFIVIWQNRVWIANTSAGKSRLHYSNAGLPEDWTSPGAAGFIDVNINDGDEITGLMPVGPAMYVFKNRTVYKSMGITPTTFNIQPIIGGRGCVAPRSIVNMGPFVMYLSQYGIHSVGDQADGFMSEAVSAWTWRGLTRTAGSRLAFRTSRRTLSLPAGRASSTWCSRSRPPRTSW